MSCAADRGAMQKRPLCGGLVLTYAAAGGAVVLLIKLDADEPAAQLLRGYESRTRTAERVKDDSVRFRERVDQRPERLHRLLCRVQAIAGILPVEDIRHRG